MMRWLKQIWCGIRGHGGIAFVRNIYGDEINLSGGNRSIWRCKKCGGTVLMPTRHSEPEYRP